MPCKVRTRRLIDSGLVGSLGGGTQDNKMSRCHLPRVVYHQVFNVYKEKPKCETTGNLGWLLRMRFDPENIWACNQSVRVLHLEATCNYFTEMCSGSEAGSYFRLIDFWITQL